MNFDNLLLVHTLFCSTKFFSLAKKKKKKYAYKIGCEQVTKF